MKYLTNENIPLNVLKTLQNINIDIISIRDFLPGAKDEEVLNFALKENRIVITFDKDFGELIFRKKFKTNIDFERHFAIVKEEK